jgi:uncharacterized protein (TIGR00290 family)
MPESIVIAWSGGKDSALALHAIRRSNAFRVEALVTTFHHGRNRNAVHGIAREIIQTQAHALDIPLVEIWLNEGASNVEYERAWTEALAPFQAQGVRRVVYGDLFLADIKAYRDQFMTRLGMEAIYPLWNLDTKKLALEFIEQGFRAKLVCVDPKQIDAGFVGREFDAALLSDLPASADPCGENGEFHTLVYASPDFAGSPLGLEERERYKRNGFAYVDYQLAVAGT